MASPPSPLSLNVVGSEPFTTVSSSTSPPTPRGSSPLKNLSPSILIIVTVLAVTVIVSLALCFLLRHLNRRCLRRFSSSSAAPSASGTPIFTSSRRISPEIPPSSIIDSLPLFTFSSITRRSATAPADCAVCLSKFDNHDLLRLLPLCCHAFHAECIDTWLQANLSCPLCRSVIVASDSDLAKVLRSSSSDGGGDSFRLQIGNVSRRVTSQDAGSVVEDSRGGTGTRSYSIGSFEYLVEEESEVPISHAHRRSVSDQKDIPAPEECPATQYEASLAGEVAGVRNWLMDYVDRVSASLSSRTVSFRSSGRFFGGGSSRRSDVVPVGDDYDMEGNGIGEEISEMFRWLSGV